MAIPSSSLPGHKQVHDRVMAALDRCQETRSVEFKESQPWDTLKHKIIRTALAMGNLRAGGIIVVGVSERNGEWFLSGIAPEHLGTYGTDMITAQVNSFASPPLDLEIVLAENAAGLPFLVIQVKPFVSSPIVCRQSGGGRLLECGRVYVRPLDMAQTVAVRDENDIRELLELAAENQARRILEGAARVGLVGKPDGSSLFDREIADLKNGTLELPVPVLEVPHWRVSFRPQNYDQELIPSLNDCFPTIAQASVTHLKWDYPYTHLPYGTMGTGKHWVAAWLDWEDRKEYWRFHQSGQFYNLFAIREATSAIWKNALEEGYLEQTARPSPGTGFIAALSFLERMTVIWEFCSRLCIRGVYDSSVDLSVGLIGIKGFVLWHQRLPVLEVSNLYAEDELERKWTYSVDDIVARSAELALNASMWFYDRFGWMRPSWDELRDHQEKFLAGKT